MLEGWLLATWMVFAGGGDLVLPPGGTIQALGPGPIVRYVADRDGAVAFALDSFEMDAFLCVTDEAGKLIAAADDGGIRQNARVVVDLRADQIVWIECTTMNVNRWSGQFTLSARAGDVPPPTGPQKDAIEGEFYRAYAGRYLVKGDPVRAAEAWAKAAALLDSAGRGPEARTAALAAIDAARRVDRSDLAINAATIASHAAERSGDQRAAIALAADAFELAIDRAGPRVATATALRLAQVQLTSGRLVEARLAFEVGRDLADDATLVAERARHEFGLAQVAHRDERLEASSRHLDTAESLARSVGDGAMVDAIELERAQLAYRRLHFADASERLEAVLTRALARGDGSTAATCRSTLGLIAMHWKSDFAVAERELAAAATAFEALGEPVNALSARLQRHDVVLRRFLRTDGVEAAPASDVVDRQLRDLDDVASRASALDAPWVEASARLLHATWSELVGFDHAALDAARAAERLFVDRVGSVDGALRARRHQASIRLRAGDVAFAGTVLDEALAYFETRGSASAQRDVVGDRVNAEAWSRLAVDVAATRVRAGADAGVEFVRCAPWRDRELCSGKPAAATFRDAQRFVAHAWPPSTRFVEFARGRDSLFAFIAGADAMRMLDVGPWRELASRSAAYVALVQDARSEAAAFSRDGRVLFDALLAPVLAGGDVARVVVGPGEDLAVLPFDALLSREVGERSSFADLPFVVRSTQIDFVPSWRTIVAAQTVSADRPSPRVLVIGDPRPTPLPPLPGAEREARGISELARVALGDATHVDAWIGEEATRARFLGVVAAADVIHVAAHAEVDWSDPVRTGIWFAGGERLTLDDVASTRLKARLTVLATCASAAGQARSGSGLLSLANAFLNAGSVGVIATRFPVDDAAADLFQRRFYRALWQRGLPPANALRAAKLEFLDGAALADEGWPRGRPAQRAESTRSNAMAHPARWAGYFHAGAEP